MTRDIKKNIRNAKAFGTEHCSDIGSKICGCIGGNIFGLIAAIVEGIIFTRLIWFSIAASLSLVAVLYTAKLIIDRLGIVAVCVIFASIAACIATVFTIIRESKPRYPQGKRKSSGKKKTHHKKEVVDSEGTETAHRNNHWCILDWCLLVVRESLSHMVIQNSPHRTGVWMFLHCFPHLGSNLEEKLDCCTPSRSSNNCNCLTGCCDSTAQRNALLVPISRKPRFGLYQKRGFLFPIPKLFL